MFAKMFLQSIFNSTNSHEFSTTREFIFFRAKITFLNLASLFSRQYLNAMHINNFSL